MEQTKNVTEISEERLQETIHGLLHTNKFSVESIERSKTDSFEHVKITIETKPKKTVNITFGLLSNYHAQSIYKYGNEIELTIVVDNSILDIYINRKRLKWLT